MSQFMAFLDTPCFWRWYFTVAVGLSITAGIPWLVRMKEMGWPERIQVALWNALGQFLGFVLFFMQIFLLVDISSSHNETV